MSSDEEEMAALRARRSGGGSQSAPATATAPPKSAAATSRAEAEILARIKANVSLGPQRPTKADSDDEDGPSSAPLQGRGHQQVLAMSGTSKASASSARRPSAPDSDEDMAGSEPDDEEVGALRKNFLPVTFGVQSSRSGWSSQAAGSSVKGHDPAKRADKKIAAKKLGVQFGPRVVEAAQEVGSASRKAAASARLAQEAEAAARAEAMEEDEREAKEKQAQAEEESLYGFGDEAPPPPGQEDSVLPVSHEAVIPAHTQNGKDGKSGKAVTAIGLDPKGSRMIAGSMDGQLKFYDFNGMSEAKESFREMEPVEGHMVQAISYSTTGGVALVVCSDSYARIYDRNGSFKPVQSTVKGDMYVRDMTHTQGHTQMLTHGMWNPHGPDNFATSSLDGTIRIWDMKAKPVGMDQVLPSMHVLKCLDKRNVCVGGSMGRGGGLYPACCAYSPNASMLVGGCSDGSVQFFNEKARYQKPDKILRTAHKGLITSVDFLGDGIGGNKLVTRSMDNSMALWDCRLLSDAKGPLKRWEDLPNTQEKLGVCSSPDGNHIVTGTSYNRVGNVHASVRVFDANDFSLVKNLDFGQRSLVGCCWQKDINQILVGTSTGEVVMLYSPYSSKKGALHFVGRHRRAKEGHEIEDSGMYPIFPMVEGKDIAYFYKTARGNLTSLRKQAARENQKTTVPVRPAALDGKSGATDGTRLVSKVILALEGKSKVHIDESGQATDSQRVLLKYADKPGDKRQYMDKIPQAPLDYSVDESEGDKRMTDSLKGDFCRKCGQKICRCVDYSQWGHIKKPKTIL